MAPAERKELDESPSGCHGSTRTRRCGIDPDAVVLRSRAIIVLRDRRARRVTRRVYISPVALKATEELSKIELRTAMTA